MALSIPNHKSWGAKILRESLPSTMCHMSGVRCQVSDVRCQVPGVKCNFFLLPLFYKVVKLVGEGLLSTGHIPSSFISIIVLFVKQHLGSYESAKC